MLKCCRSAGSPARMLRRFLPEPIHDARTICENRPCIGRECRYLCPLDRWNRSEERTPVFAETHVELLLNAELTRKALEKVGNPNVLVNLVSRRVRQLNSGSGALSRPLVAETGNLGAADVALLEIIEDKVGFEMPEPVELARPHAKKRRRH